MFCTERTPPLQELLAVGTVEFQIARQTTARLFNIGSCLIKCEWQPIHLFYDSISLRPLLRADLFERSSERKQLGPAQKQPGSLVLLHFINHDAGSDVASSVRTSREQDMPCVPRRQEVSDQPEVIGVVKDKQPSCVLSQPAFDSGHHDILILLICLGKE